ncbi:MAG: efflux RND transporter periplasmic adaptor subunit [Candidatus Moranbacteria bacterium]|nr:efflux RND transporter periplasmic adaptor subunit [Candidatus Moranbacteria bacterium]
MAKKHYLWIVAALVIAGGSYYWYAKTHPEVEAVRYKTVVVGKGNLITSVSGSGQAEAVSQVDLKPVVAGDAIDVISVYVKNEQAVKKGELIALLDNEDAQKTVRNAELGLESAKAKYTQAKRDFDHESINKLSLEGQRVSLEQSRNSLADAREKLNDYYIRAPFDGIVTGLSVEAGDSVSRSDVLASVITKDVQARVSINEIDAAQVKVGNKVTIKISALSDATITGKVAKIDTIGQTSQNVVSYDAEISFDNQNELLKPGMSVSASVITGAKQDVITVPNSAIRTRNGSNYVETLDDGTTPRQVPVEIGLTNNSETEITGGLDVGDIVVIQTINADASGTATSGGNSSGIRLPGLGGSRLGG